MVYFTHVYESRDLCVSMTHLKHTINENFYTRSENIEGAYWILCNVGINVRVCLCVDETYAQTQYYVRDDSEQLQ